MKLWNYRKTIVMKRNCEVIEKLNKFWKNLWSMYLLWKILNAIWSVSLQNQLVRITTLAFRLCINIALVSYRSFTSLTANITTIPLITCFCCITITYDLIVYHKWMFDSFGNFWVHFKAILKWFRIKIFFFSVLVKFI